MNRFTIKKLCRTLALAAVVAVGSVCWSGCGGDDNPSGGGDTGGSNTGGNNTGGNNTGGSNIAADGTFNPIEIGNQTWADRNTNVRIEGKTKCYGGKADSCTKYGRLYAWEDALTICPAGWKLPDTADFSELLAAVGGAAVAGDKLKSKSGWKSNGNGVDEFKFNALPGGYVYLSGSNLVNNNGGGNGYWWSATESGKVQGYYLGMSYSNDNASYKSALDKDRYLSVRCILDRTNLTWSAWAVTTPATCDSSGVETRTSRTQNINVKETRPIPPLGHDWGEWAATPPATCDAPGVETRTCARNAKHKETRVAWQLYGAACTANPSDFVEIGGKKWMKKNMNVPTDSSWCYGDADSNCVKYGRLYTWKMAMEICPSGTHLPSREEFAALGEAAGGMSTAGAKLKAEIGWDDKNGTNDFGFTALPGGYRNYESKFYSIGTNGGWWTSYPSGSTHVDNRYSYGMSSTSDGLSVQESYNSWANGRSVRCVMDD